MVQFGGGLSTALAIAAGSSNVTVAEGDRGILNAFRTQKVLRDFTGDILNKPGVTVIDYDGVFISRACGTSSISSIFRLPTRRVCPVLRFRDR